MRFSNIAVAAAISLVFPATPFAQSTNARAMDVSGAALFWQAVDRVSSGDMSPDSARDLLGTHPGYQQIDRAGSRLRVIHHCFRGLAPGVDRDTLAIPQSSRAFLYPYVCNHIDSAIVHRAELERFMQSIARDSDEQRRIGRALDSARLLLPESMPAGEPPPVYGLIFEPGGFGGTSIAVDLLRHLRRTPEERVSFFAHEFHHIMMGRLPSDLVPQSGATTQPAMVWWLGRTQWEGIASLLDKQAFVELTSSGPRPSAAAREGFPAEHAKRLSESAQVLSLVDSALSRRQRGQGTTAELTAALEASIPDGGHALGQYFAMAIEAAEGRPGIVAATASRFAFVRAYQRAALARPRQFTAFSEEAMSYFMDAERRLATPKRP